MRITGKPQGPISDRLQRAIRAVADPGVSFAGTFLNPFRSLRSSPDTGRIASHGLVPVSILADGACCEATHDRTGVVLDTANPGDCIGRARELKLHRWLLVCDGRAAQTAGIAGGSPGHRFDRHRRRLGRPCHRLALGMAGRAGLLKPGDLDSDDRVGGASLAELPRVPRASNPAGRPL
jgi:hypothetical protein